MSTDAAVRSQARDVNGAAVVVGAPVEPTGDVVLSGRVVAVNGPDDVRVRWAVSPDGGIEFGVHPRLLQVVHRCLDVEAAGA